MHAIAVNVIVHYNKASTSIVFLCLFKMVLILYDLWSFYTSSVKKGEGLLHACIF